MDTLTHTIIAVGSLSASYYLGTYLKSKSVFDDIVGSMFDKLEKDIEEASIFPIAEEFGELVVPSSNNNSSSSSSKILLSIERCLGRVLKTVSAARVLKSAGQLCS